MQDIRGAFRSDHWVRLRRYGKGQIVAAVRVRNAHGSCDRFSAFRVGYAHHSVCAVRAASPGDKAVSLSGMPYDTLKNVIFGKGNGSLADFGIKFDTIPTVCGAFDKDEIARRLSSEKFALIYIQRSPGYERRKAYSVSDIKQIIKFVREYSDAPIAVDNCYGEFVETAEPTEVGAIWSWDPSLKTREER